VQQREAWFVRSRLGQFEQRAQLETRRVAGIAALNTRIQSCSREYSDVSIQSNARNVRTATDATTASIRAFWPLRQLRLLRALRALRWMETPL